MFSIGELAKISNTTVRTLRYYDEIGLLKPAKISEGNHRYYDGDAIEKLHNIMTLKELGLDLETIKRILVEEIKTSKELLEIKLKALEAKQKELEQQKKTITSLIEVMDVEGKNDWTTIFNTFSTLKKHDQKEMMKNWRTFFTQKERKILSTMPKLGENDPLGKKWLALLKETKKYVDVDPTSEIGQRIAKKWLIIINIIYQGDWELAQKVWEIHFEKHKDLGFYPLDEDVIDFIRKAQTYFFEQNMDNVNQVFDYE